MPGLAASLRGEPLALSGPLLSEDYEAPNGLGAMLFAHFDNDAAAPSLDHSRALVRCWRQMNTKGNDLA